MIANKGLVTYMEGKSAWQEKVSVVRISRILSQGTVYLRIYDDVSEEPIPVDVYQDYYVAVGGLRMPTAQISIKCYVE